MVRASMESRYGEMPVSGTMQNSKGRSISSQGAVLYATTRTELEAIRHPLLSRNKMAITTVDENNVFVPSGK